MTVFKMFQKQTFQHIHQALLDGKLPIKSNLSKFCSYLDHECTLIVRRRLERAEVTYYTKHPVVLHNSSPPVKLFCLHLHQTTGHSGPTTLEAILCDDFLIVGVRRLLKSISRLCILCQRAYMRIQQQKMWQLSADRTRPESPLTILGVWILLAL